MAVVSTFLDLLRKSIFEEQKNLDQLHELEKNLNIVDPVWGKHIEDEITYAKEALSRCREGMARLVNTLLRLPPWHVRHHPILKDFFKDGDYDLSVFIMTKFPEGSSAPDDRLRNIINLVKAGLKNRNLVPRIADSAKYHPLLWDEIEIHLLGCARGIAIIEDRYRPELNPNVAMEWGWMRAMGKDVLYLQEKQFTHKRADFDGLVMRQFDWDNPDSDIEAALTRWLGF